MSFQAVRVQRVAAARALMSRPEIIFADEPSGNLDSKSGAELLDFLRLAVDDFGQTIVMVTHDASAASRADRIVFLDDGKTVGEMRDPTTESVLEPAQGAGELTWSAPPSRESSPTNSG